MRRLAPLLLVLVLLLAACGGTGEIVQFDPADDPTGTATETIDGADDGSIGPDPALTDPASAQPPGGPAAGSCLADDPDCTDESFDGQDVTRPVPLTDEAPAGESIPTGESDIATGQMITGANVDGATLTLGWEGSPCDVLIDPMVIEDDVEVRVLVLAGAETGTEACATVIQPWTTTVELDAPLGDRALLDISG